MFSGRYRPFDGYDSFRNYPVLNPFPTHLDHRWRIHRRIQMRLDDEHGMCSNGICVQCEG